jgi:hypothetical protein
MMAPTPKIISRAGWQADPPTSVTRLPWGRIDTIYVHYTASEADRVGDPRARMRGIQDYHQDTNGWADIAYSFAFTYEGDVLEGRGWEVYPAATAGQNGHSVAFVFLGADKEGRDDVTDRGRKALGWLILEAQKRAGKRLEVKGHREDVATACP